MHIKCNAILLPPPHSEWLGHASYSVLEVLTAAGRLTPLLRSNAWSRPLLMLSSRRGTGMGSRAAASSLSSAAVAAIPAGTGACNEVMRCVASRLTTLCLYSVRLVHPLP